MRLITKLSYTPSAIFNRQAGLFRLVDDQGISCLTGQVLVVDEGKPRLWAEYTLGQASQDKVEGRHLVRWGSCKTPRALEGVSVVRVGPADRMNKFTLQRAMRALEEGVRKDAEPIGFNHPTEFPVRGGTWRARYISPEIQADCQDLLHGCVPVEALEQFHAGRLLAFIPPSRLRWTAYEAEWFDTDKDGVNRQVWQILQPHLTPPKLGSERELQPAAPEAAEQPAG